MMFKWILLVALFVAAVAAQNATDVCTSSANKNNCFKCMSVAGSACFYCSNTGCRPNTPTEHQTCTSGEGSAYDKASSCPDPCYNPDSNSCNDCLSSSCGYCSSVGSCMTGQSSGPSYQSCGTWRFRNSTSPLSTTQACASFQSCSAITNCNSCISVAQSADTPCNWCGSSCVAGNNCPSGSTLMKSCPSPDMSGASAVAAGLVSFAGLLAVLAL